MFFSFFAAFFPTLNAAVEGYAHRIDFSVVGYQGTTTLVNYPLAVKLSENIKDFSYDDFLSAGKDLRFTLKDGTELAHELDNWNPSGESVAWVKIPAFTNGLEISIYYGKANDTAPTQSVFKDAGYTAALHLSESAGPYADATGNGYSAADASSQGKSVSSADGLFGQSVLISSETAQGGKMYSGLKVSSFTASGLTDTFTFSAWYRQQTAGQAVGEDLLFSFGQKCKYNTYWGLPKNGTLLDPGCWNQEHGWRGQNFANVFGGDGINDGTWHYVVVAVSGTSVWLYDGGELKASGTLVEPMAINGSAWVLGSDYNVEGSSFRGSIDEARVHPQVLSADWIAADYAAGTDTTGSFLSLYKKTVYVVPPSTANHTPIAPYYSWKTAATNIQLAVDSNTQNFDVKIAPGIYPILSRLTLNNANVTYACVDPQTDLPVCGGVVIEAGGCEWTASAVRLEGASMRGFSILNATNTADGALGGGLSVAADANGEHFIADTVISNCYLSSTKSKPSGGGVYLAQGWYGTMTNCLIIGNAAPLGGGFYYSQANAAALETHPTIVNCSFVSNWMNNAWGNGGAAYAGGICFDRCSFVGAMAPIIQTYAPCVYDAGYVQYLGCQFSDNATTMYGGSGIYAADTSTSVIRGCTFTRNADKAYYGKGTLEACTFTNNYGAAVYGLPNLRNCLVANNGDKGVWISPAAGTNTIENTTIVGNGSYGIQSAVTGVSLTRIVNSIVTGNSDKYGYATWSAANECIVTNSVVNGIYYDKRTRDTSLDSNHWTYSLAQVKFTDAANGDYTLQRKSPCRDKGLTLDWMTSESTDLGGNPRVFGDAPDLGCYECQLGARGLILIFR